MQRLRDGSRQTNRLPRSQLMLEPLVAMSQFLRVGFDRLQRYKFSCVGSKEIGEFFALEQRRGKSFNFTARRHSVRIPTPLKLLIAAVASSGEREPYRE